MNAVAAPADRRFHRPHVKPARRKRGWRALIRPLLLSGALGLPLAYGVYWASSVAAHAHVLQVERIVVRGNDRLSKGEVLAVLNGLRGESLVWVVVTERQPIGIGRINGDMYLVDERGVIIDQYGPRYADLDLPIVDGLPASPTGRGSTTDEARAELAARVIAAVRMKPQVARRLSQVDVTDAHNATVILNRDRAVLQLGDDRFLARLQAYLDLAPALRERVPDIDYVDLRFDGRIYVRPAKVTRPTGATGTAEAAPHERRK